MCPGGCSHEEYATVVSRAETVEGNGLELVEVEVASLHFGESATLVRTAHQHTSAATIRGL